MFRKFVVSMLVAFLFMSSSTLIAENNNAPVTLAAVQFESQLLANDGQKFAQNDKPIKIVGEANQVKKELTLPVVARFWIMMAGVLLFVLRRGAQRISLMINRGCFQLR